MNEDDGGRTGVGYGSRRRTVARNYCLSWARTPTLAPPAHATAVTYRSRMTISRGMSMRPWPPKRVPAEPTLETEGEGSNSVEGESEPKARKPRTRKAKTKAEDAEAEGKTPVAVALARKPKAKGIRESEVSDDKPKYMGCGAPPH